MAQCFDPTSEEGACSKWEECLPGGGGGQAAALLKGHWLRAETGGLVPGLTLNFWALGQLPHLFWALVSPLAESEHGTRPQLCSSGISAQSRYLLLLNFLFSTPGRLDARIQADGGVCIHCPGVFTTNWLDCPMFLSRAQTVTSDQEKRLLHQLREITRVMREGRLIDRPTPEQEAEEASPTEDWEGKASACVFARRQPGRGSHRLWRHRLCC